MWWWATSQSIAMDEHGRWNLCQPKSVDVCSLPVQLPAGTQLPTQLTGGHGLLLVQLAWYLWQVGQHCTIMSKRSS